MVMDYGTRNLCDLSDASNAFAVAEVKLIFCNKVIENALLQFKGFP
jgi:hypothetical protein